MTNPITPEAVERLAAEADSWNRCYPGNLNVEVLVREMTDTLRSLARELAEVKAERDRLHGDIDWLRFQREVMHRRAQKAEGLLSRAMQFADGIILIAKKNGTYPRYALAMKRFARARTGEAFSLGYYLWSKELEAAKADLTTARAQIVTAQEDMRDRAAEICANTGVAWVKAAAIRALPLTAPADALAVHDRAVRADERAKCAAVASAETGWDGVPYMSQMQYGPGIGKRIAAAILARGEQEGT